MCEKEWDENPRVRRDTDVPVTVWVREKKKLNGENKSGARKSERAKGTDRQKGRTIQKQLEHFFSLQIMTWHVVRFALCIQGAAGGGHTRRPPNF